MILGKSRLIDAFINLKKSIKNNDENCHYESVNYENNYKYYVFKKMIEFLKNMLETNKVKFYLGFIQGNETDEITITSRKYTIKVSPSSQIKKKTILVIWSDCKNILSFSICV